MTLQIKLTLIFTNIGSSLAAQTPECSHNYADNITVNYLLHRSMFVEPTDESEVTNIIQSLQKKLQPNKSPGYDGYSPRAIKGIAHTITKSSTHLLNLSLSTGVFPHKLKIAKFRQFLKLMINSE